jgi:hypothetical protein
MADVPGARPIRDDLDRRMHGLMAEPGVDRA